MHSMRRNTGRKRAEAWQSAESFTLIRVEQPALRRHSAGRRPLLRVLILALLGIWIGKFNVRAGQSPKAFWYRAYQF